MRTPLRVLAALDWWLVLLAAILAWVGVTFIGSAITTERGAGFQGQDLRQLVSLVVAAGAGLLLVLIPYARIMRVAPALYLLALGTLAAVFLFGTIKNGARRWIGPAFLQIQPSEFAKLAVIIALAAYLRLRSHAKTWEGLLVPLGITLVPATLVLAQPDLSTSLVLWPIWLAMCFVAGAPRKSLVVLLLVGAAGMYLAWKLIHTYQQERVLTWWEHWWWDDVADPKIAEKLRNQAFQPWQSEIAIGGGGLMGAGIGAGPQNVSNFLPFRQSDYIFAVVCEETGWLGAVGVLGLEIALALGCLWIGARSRERFGRLCCVGVGVLIGTQALVHAGVCSWLLPSTGLPMPLVSAGRSSCVSTVLAVALVLNVGARREPVLSGDGFR